MFLSVISAINEKTGGGTKYINWRDRDFLPSGACFFKVQSRRSGICRSFGTAFREGVFAAAFRLVVGVYAAQDKVDPEVGDDDAEESQRTVKMEAAWRLVDVQRSVHRYGVDDERDERPHLFRVPRPIAAPRDVGPHGADDDAQRQQEDGRVEQHQVDATEAVGNVGPSVHNQAGDAARHDEEEQGVGEHDDSDVQCEQR